MAPDEYGICVVSGRNSLSQTSAVVADAYVYAWGGRNFARFTVSAGGNIKSHEEEATHKRLRAQARREAEAWIALQEQAV